VVAFACTARFLRQGPSFGGLCWQPSGPGVLAGAHLQSEPQQMGASLSHLEMKHLVSGWADDSDPEQIRVSLGGSVM